MRQVQRHRSAVGMANQMKGFVRLQRLLQHPLYETCLVREPEVVDQQREGRVAIAEQVDRDDSVAAAQLLGERVPLALVAHRTMQQHHCRPVTLHTIADGARAPWLSRRMIIRCGCPSGLRVKYSRLAHYSSKLIAELQVHSCVSRVPLQLPCQASVLSLKQCHTR
jgi:hypothetical protein